MHCEINFKLVFHEKPWKKNFTVYPSLYSRQQKNWGSANRNEYFHDLKDNVPNGAFIGICERIINENKSLSPAIVQTQNSKYQRGNITIDRTDNEWYALNRRGYRK